MVPGKWRCFSAVFAAIPTLAPSRAARNAMARPMPREPPVINIVLPLRLIAHPTFPRRYAHDGWEESGTQQGILERCACVLCGASFRKRAMSLCDIPEIAAHHEPKKVALWFEGRSWTFTDL